MCETRAEGTFILFSQHTDIGFEKHANSVIGYEAHGVLFFKKKRYFDCARSVDDVSSVIFLYTE